MSLIPNVRIALDGVIGHTDENGSAEFTVDEGTYRVTISKSGYIMQSFSVTVNTDLEFEITLEHTTRESLFPPAFFIEVGLALISLVKEARE